jgi:hypothetical protein
MIPLGLESAEYKSLMISANTGKVDLAAAWPRDDKL